MPNAFYDNNTIKPKDRDRTPKIHETSTRVSVTKKKPRLTIFCYY